MSEVEETKEVVVNEVVEAVENDCSICLENITEDELLILACSHMFHKGCIVRQMTFGSNARVCALCRLPLPALNSLIPNYRVQYVSVVLKSIYRTMCGYPTFVFV